MLFSPLGVREIANLFLCRLEVTLGDLKRKWRKEPNMFGFSLIRSLLLSVAGSVRNLPFPPTRILPLPRGGEDFSVEKSCATVVVVVVRSAAAMEKFPL